MSPLESFLNEALTFIYSIAHYIGTWVLQIIRSILPSIDFPQSLADPIGFLAVLTIFLFLVQVAKKTVWIIVIVGWVLIIIRIILVITGLSQ